MKPRGCWDIRVLVRGGRKSGCVSVPEIQIKFPTEVKGDREEEYDHYLQQQSTNRYHHRPQQTHAWSRRYEWHKVSTPPVIVCVCTSCSYEDFFTTTMIHATTNSVPTSVGCGQHNNISYIMSSWYIHRQNIKSKIHTKMVVWMCYLWEKLL